MRISTYQASLLSHAIGLRTESGSFKARRNHYYSNGVSSHWASLVDKGFAIQKRNHKNKKIITYQVTELGIEELERIKKVIIFMDTPR